jgi:hypothetical protein
LIQEFIDFVFDFEPDINKVELPQPIHQMRPIDLVAGHSQDTRNITNVFRLTAETIKVVSD